MHWALDQLALMWTDSDKGRSGEESVIVVDQRPEDPSADARMLLEQSLAHSERVRSKMQLVIAILVATLLAQSVTVYIAFETRSIAREANYNAILATESAQQAEKTASDAFYEASSMVASCESSEVE